MMDKEALLAVRLPHSDLDIPGVGIVQVRGLSRREALIMQEASSTDRELLLIHFGMVHPQISKEEVAQWQASSPAGELEPVTIRIAELSGMNPNADQEAYKSLRHSSRTGV